MKKSEKLKKLALLGLASGVLMTVDAEACDCQNAVEGVEVSNLVAKSCGGGCATKDDPASAKNASYSSNNCNGKSVAPSNSCNGRRSSYYADNGCKGAADKSVVPSNMNDDQAAQRLDPLDRDVYKTMNDKQKALVKKLLSK